LGKKRFLNILLKKYVSNPPFAKGGRGGLAILWFEGDDLS
jgi:hypothetical protein